MNYLPIINKMRRVYARILIDYADPSHCNLLSLMADNFPNYSVDELIKIIKMAQLPLNETFRLQVSRY